MRRAAATPVARLALVIALLALVPSWAAAQSESVEYYGLDALGSVRVVFDASGAILGRMDYGPFGQELSNGTGLPSRGYAGLFRDGEAGLDHAEARSYQSRTGRFSTVDPVYAGLFHPQEWNRYAYALNSPLTFVDPDGLQAANTCPPGVHYCEVVEVKAPPPPPIIVVQTFTPMGAHFPFALPPRGSPGRVPPTGAGGSGGGDGGAGGGGGDSGTDQECTLPAEGRWLPNYFSYQINIAIPNPVTGTLVGITGQLTIDSFANVYIGGGGGFGKSATVVAGSTTFGWLDGSSSITSTQVSSFLTGRAVNVGGGAGPGLGRTESLSTGQRATEFGLYTPQVGATATHSVRLFSLNSFTGGDVCK
jgi:RHS repeat-associated protein